MAAHTKWIEIARAGGPYRALSGEEVTITPADLDAAVESFDPADRRVPLVLGHPKLDDPAYGWLADVKRDGDVLVARFRDVPEPVREAVDQGRYRNVSAKFVKGWRLWHVGLLGAAQPAIPGLAEVRLADETDGHIFEFAKEATMDELTRLRQEAADAKAALKEALDELAKLKAEKATEGKAKELAAQIEDLEKRLQAAETDRDKAVKEFAAFRDDQTAKGRENRFDALVAAGKALPGEKPKVMAFAAALGRTGGEVELAAGEGKTEKLPHEEAYWRELEGRPENGLTHEFAAPAQSSAQKGGNAADLTGKV